MNESLTAVIIDDEPVCVDNLEYYLMQYCPKIQVKYKTTSIQEFLSIIKNNKPDIAFLDIEIFDGSIFDALSEVANFDFKIVFVTAHEAYALKAFKVEALDYILKPLDKQEIINCYLKILKHFFEKEHVNNIVASNTEIAQNNTDGNNKIVLRHADNIYIIHANDIYYLKANGYYTVVYYNYNGENKLITISKPIAALEHEYNYNNLYRIHKSYSINVSRITNIIKKKNMVFVKMANNDVIPVSKRKVNDFLSFKNN